MCTEADSISNILIKQIVHKNIQSFRFCTPFPTASVLQIRFLKSLDTATVWLKLVTFLVTVLTQFLVGLVWKIYAFSQTSLSFNRISWSRRSSTCGRRYLFWSLLWGRKLPLNYSKMLQKFATHHFFTSNLQSKSIFIFNVMIYI